MLSRPICLRTQPQAPTLLPNDVDNPKILVAPSLTLEYVTVNSRLESVLVARESIEMEVEKSFAVSILDGTWEENTKEALFVVGMGTTKTKESEWSQLVALPRNGKRPVL